jgi:hypothetical protein
VHPILRRLERLASYLAAWLVVGTLLAAVITRLGLTWPEALALLLPLSLVYSFACLSAWYVCRATPLTTSSVSRVLMTAGLSSLVAGTLWLILANVWIEVLTATPMFAPAADRYAQELPFLFATGVLLFLVSVAGHYTLIAVEAAREAERHQLELQVLTRDAQLRALRAQVDPHFLYNSLNSISALTGSDPAGARRMCVLLAEFLRSTLDVSNRARISLGEELALAEKFLSIEQVRFGPRLQVERNIDRTVTGCSVPPLILQPLVENAVTHGIAGLLEGGTIRLEALPKNGRLVIVIDNPRDVDVPALKHRGLGLDNVRQRLAAVFDKEATMQTRTDEGRFRVELDLPADHD